MQSNGIPLDGECKTTDYKFKWDMEQGDEIQREIRLRIACTLKVLKYTLKHVHIEITF